MRGTPHDGVVGLSRPNRTSVRGRPSADGARLSTGRSRAVGLHTALVFLSADRTGVEADQALMAASRRVVSRPPLPGLVGLREHLLRDDALPEIDLLARLHAL